MDNLGEQDLTDWAKLHGWTDRPIGTPDFCYINFPDPETKTLYGVNRDRDGNSTTLIGTIQPIGLAALEVLQTPLAIEGLN